LIVIGAGAVGLELGSVWKRLGAEVTVLEFMDTILPGIDSDIAKQALRYFKRQKIEIRTGIRVRSAKRAGDTAVVTLEGGETLTADRVLSAAGRSPNTEGLGLDSLGVALDGRGFIQIDDRYETAVRGIFAAGDVVGGTLLAHKASEEGIACVEGMAGMKGGRVHPNLVPGVVYTEPEIAAVGRTEDSLKAEAVEFLKGEFLFRANARAQAHEAIEGSVKILADKHTRKLLGVHIIGPFAGELIAEACLAMQCGLSVEDMAHTCHAHPTLSECLKEAALAALGRAIHA
jgi:dihydrolipoamide dehydrogenase